MAAAPRVASSEPAGPPDAATIVRADHPVDVVATLGVVRCGSWDTSVRVAPGEVVRATRTPEGPATVRYTATGADVSVQAWGPGGAWAVEHAPEALGVHDGAAAFVAHHPVVAGLWRRHRGLRIARTRAVVETLVPAVLEQKVATGEAQRAYGDLLRALRETAPGPGGLTLPPSPAALARLPVWQAHRCGIEMRRAGVLRRIGLSAGRLEETADMSVAAARARLDAVPGVGPWTVARVSMVALGDSDAVPVGDYNLPNLVAWALEGRREATDEDMLDLLEPYRGQRARVVRLLLLHGGPPRRAPRAALRDFRRQ